MLEIKFKQLLTKIHYFLFCLTSLINFYLNFVIINYQELS